jgi:hypothetical protein
MRFAVTPTMQPCGAMYIKVTTDEYSSYQDFADRDGPENAMLGVREGIRLGYYNEKEIVAFFVQDGTIKDIDFYVERSNGQELPQGAFNFGFSN